MDELSFKEIRTWGQSKITYLTVLLFGVNKEKFLNSIKNQQRTSLLKTTNGYSMLTVSQKAYTTNFWLVSDWDYKYFKNCRFRD